MVGESVFTFKFPLYDKPNIPILLNLLFIKDLAILTLINLSVLTVSLKRVSLFLFFMFFKTYWLDRGIQ